MSRIFRFVIFAGLFFSAGCASLAPLLDSLITPTPVPTKQATSTPTVIATATLPVEQNVPILRVWLPSEFHPTVENPAAKLLDQRLTKFETQHPGLKIEVRVKTADTDGEILNDLSVTSAAAPGVLPDLVLLSRPDLEAAALKGLLHPIDGLSTSLEDPNWYEYAQQLGHVQNTGYGLPFMGDAMVLVYYPELGMIVNWEDVLASQGQLVFQAGNPDGLTGLSLYASAGGQILDPQGLPTLDEDSLVRVLTLIEEGRSKKVFPPSLVNVSNETQALQIYRTGSANKGIIWILNYHPTSDGSIAPLPGLDEAPFSYATGWVWALAGSDPENQQLAAKLAEYLVADDFIAEWTETTGFLPTRPSSIKDEDRTMSAILESAHLIPSSSIIAVLGPLMQEAITRVLIGEAPKDVAASVIQKLK
jgi:ABC-type glycerol-3-phosphate transport system substrate-binding protein